MSVLMQWLYCLFVVRCYPCDLWVFYVCSLFCYAYLFFQTSRWRIESWLFYFFLLDVIRGCYCHSSPLHVVMGWSAVFCSW